MREKIANELMVFHKSTKNDSSSKYMSMNKYDKSTVNSLISKWQINKCFDVKTDINSVNTIQDNLSKCSFTYPDNLETFHLLGNH